MFKGIDKINQIKIEILSIFILLIITIPGFITYNNYNFNYIINTNSVSWSSDGSKLAFVREKEHNNENLIEIMVWSRETNSFESIHFITNNLFNGCETFPFASCIPDSSVISSIRIKFSFNNENTLLATIITIYIPSSYRSVVFLYDLSSKSEIAMYDSMMNVVGPYPDVIWNNGTLLFAMKDKVINLLNGNIYSTFSSFIPYTTPILSNNGHKLATVIHQNEYNLLIYDFQTKEILKNTSQNYYFYPVVWNKNDSELLLIIWDDKEILNYSIYDSNLNKIIFSLNKTNYEYLYYLSPDFKYLIIKDQRIDKFSLYDLEQRSNITIHSNNFVMNPQANLVFTGGIYLFNITRFPTYRNFQLIKFNESEKNSAFFSSVVGTSVIFILIILKHYRKNLLFSILNYNK